MNNETTNTPIKNRTNRGDSRGVIYHLRTALKNLIGFAWLAVRPESHAINRTGGFWFLVGVLRLGFFGWGFFGWGFEVGALVLRLGF